jgi:hypothetical protein
MGKGRLVSLGLAAAAAFAAYLRFGRRWVLTWGATQEEIDRELPGDQLLPGAWLQATRAVTVEAPPHAIWPWLVQMGPQPRAGAYTYDWVERLLGIDIENRGVILPEYQHLEPGQFMGLNDKGEGLRVVALEQEMYLLLQWEPQQSTWLFALQPEAGGKTRLMSRNRLPDVTTYRIPGPKVLSWLFMVLFMEPGSLVMERKMLLTIKGLSERLWREELRQAEAAATQPAPLRP